jgi:hypothetical protein
MCLLLFLGVRKEHVGKFNVPFTVLRHSQRERGKLSRALYGSASFTKGTWEGPTCPLRFFVIHKGNVGRSHVPFTVLRHSQRERGKVQCALYSSLSLTKGTWEGLTFPLRFLFTHEGNVGTVLFSKMSLTKVHTSLLLP